MFRPKTDCVSRVSAIWIPWIYWLNWGFTCKHQRIYIWSPSSMRLSDQDVAVSPVHMNRECWHSRFAPQTYGMALSKWTIFNSQHDATTSLLLLILIANVNLSILFLFASHYMNTTCTCSICQIVFDAANTFFMQTQNIQQKKKTFDFI